MRDFNTFGEVVEDPGVDTCRNGEAEVGGHFTESRDAQTQGAGCGGGCSPGMGVEWTHTS